MDEKHGTQNARGSAQDLDETIEAIDGVGRVLNAVTSVMGDRARTLERKSAERAAAGEAARPLEGIPFAVKDVIDVAGFPTTMGSNVSSGPDPSTTAPVVNLLEKAGALPVVKTNCHEYSYGILGDESAFGRVINPLDSELCTAGSSSGSAALVAAGVVPLALGTDTAGSVRVPAACQGVIGFKPTFGAVSVEGVYPLSPSFDTVGLLARDIPTLTSAFAAIAGYSKDSLVPSPAKSPVKLEEKTGLLTVDASPLQSADESAHGVRTWTERTLADVTTTSAKAEELGEIIERCIGVYDVVRRYEAYVLHRQFTDEQGELYQPGVWAKIMAGQTITEAEYQEQIVALEELRASAVAVFDDVDFIITPAMDGDVIRWDQIGPDSAARFMRYSMPFNVLGWPAITLPIGAVVGRALGETVVGGAIGGLTVESPSDTASGNPESVQIVGPPHSDEKLLEFAAAFSTE